MIGTRTARIAGQRGTYQAGGECVSVASGDGSYDFAGGYPTPETVQRAFDGADLNRAVQACRFFYPTMSIVATWKGNLRAGMVENKVLGLLEATAKQFVFIACSACDRRSPCDVARGSHAELVMT